MRSQILQIGQVWSSMAHIWNYASVNILLKKSERGNTLRNCFNGGWLQWQNDANKLAIY